MHSGNITGELIRQVHNQSLKLKHSSSLLVQKFTDKELALTALNILVLFLDPLPHSQHRSIAVSALEEFISTTVLTECYPEVCVFASMTLFNHQNVSFHYTHSILALLIVKPTAISTTVPILEEQ